MVSLDPRRSGYARVAALLIVLLAIPARGADDRRGWGDPCRAADAVRSAAIHDLYQRRGRAPVWLNPEGRTPAGRRLVRLLRAAGDGVMTDCLEAALAAADGRYAVGELDVMLTDAYLELGERRSGADAGRRKLLAALAPGRQSRLQQRLDGLAAASAAAQGRPTSAPAADADARMASAIQRYRRIVARGGWPVLGSGPAIEPGERDPRVPALAERLAATGDLEPPARAAAGNRYDDALVRAVRRFQARHGLARDGVVGTATRSALDVPARQRLAQLERNRDRIESHPIDGDGLVVRVNIPDFRVTLHEGGRVVFRTRAIVGRPDQPTPSLESRITALTLNPAWNVPRTIVREDLAPLFARDDGYAARNGFHAVNTERPLAEFDWSEKPMVPVRQAPGPNNALGRIKFEMPNARAIDLHDTPEQHLFDARRRAFSAGCVRVEQPMALAARLTGIARERLVEMARDGGTRTLRVGWRIPVQLVYFTAWVDRTGRVQFRRDIYGRDAVRSSGDG